MKLRLFKRYFLVMGAVICISIIAILMLLTVVLNNYVAGSTYKSLKQSCTEVSSTVADGGEANIQQGFLSISHALSSVLGSDMFITDQHGTVVVCACDEWQSVGKCLHSSYIVPKDVIKRAVNGKRPVVDNMGMYANPYCVAADSFEIDKTYYVFATKPMEQVQGLMTTITRLLVRVAIIPILLMFGLSVFITYRMAKPLKNMSDAAKAMAKGDFSKRIPVTSDDEIGELAVSFNMMTNSLSRLETMRRSFVGSVSHELRTPMTTISGFIDGILDGTIPEDKHEYYLSIVSSEVKRLSRLVNGMLDISKLEAGEVELKKEAFSIREMVFSIVIGQEQRIEKGGFEIEGLDTLTDIKISADRDLIHQVVYNLVDNAIKFTNQNGKISFTLSEENDNITFVVKNTGEGIPESELPFVFERFYKGDKSRSDIKNSLGLGLYLVKTIVLAHKGQVSVASRQGQFTAFKVILPKGENNG